MYICKTWVYRQTEEELWTVGFYDPAGKWHPESDWGSPEQAADRVHWLNGGRAYCETKRDNMVRCPLKHYIECDREKCAWWHQSQECCAVLLIAKRLGRLEGNLP